ncbi:MobC family plasmid mobilization relaxosome protein [Streptomyces sp. PSKA01]|uniref:MobC family plasmid mobilization relaxosome protein n=1 Tax=Streptomyces cupreus TaxID=2759956 RepID=A0A7X1M8X5_9ACTN|nr:MobC family plasmid mobilization relaxosome protein [Streptomyces cupreus]
MTALESSGTHSDLGGPHCPARSRASCSFRNSSAATGCGGVSEAHAPAPGGAGEARHQGVPGSEAATEGGSQPGEEPNAPATSRTRPRLRQSVHRDQVRSVRLTSDELELVKRAAEAVGLKTAGFLADAAVAVAQAQGGPQPWLLDQRGRVEELMAASAQLARVGNNLNQVARILNSGGQVAYADDAIARVLRAADRVEAAAIEIARR